MSSQKTNTVYTLFRKHIKLKTKLRFIRTYKSLKKTSKTENTLSAEPKAGGEQQLEKRFEKKLFEYFVKSLTKNTFVLKISRKCFMNKDLE
jgi:hypothetical protein